MSPGEAADSFGWGAILTLGLSAATALLGYGASNQRSKQTQTDLDKLEKETDKRICEAKEIGERTSRELAAFQLTARDRFVVVDDLRRVESTLSEQIVNSKNEMTQKVEQLRVEFGKKGIEHTIKNAISIGMAQAILEAKRRGGE